MRYVVNKRGRAMEKPDNEAEELLQNGFVEVTKVQFDTQKYFVEFDKGPGHQTQAVESKKVQETKEEKDFLETTIV